MQYFKIIINYLKPYSNRIITGLFIKFIGTLFTLFSFLMFIPFFDVLFSNQSLIENPVPLQLTIESIKHNLYYLLSQIIAIYGKEIALLFIGGLVLIMATIQALCQYYISSSMIFVSQSAGRDLRAKLFHNVLFLPLNFFYRYKKGDILSRLSVDVNKFQSLVITAVFSILISLVSIFIYSYSLFYINTYLTLLIAILSFLTILIINRVGKRLREMAKLGMESYSENISFLDATLYGIKMVKICNAEKHIYSTFKKLNRHVTKIMIKMGQRNALYNPLTRIIGITALVVIMILGGILIIQDNGNMNSQTFISYLLVLYQIINPAKSLSNIYYKLQQGLASYERIDTVMQLQNLAKQESNLINIRQFKQDITYSNVYFKYENQFVLKQIDVTIKKGETIALVGRSGAGKSTFVDLLAKFYDINEGDIFIDGISIKNIDMHSLRELIGMVTQEPILFHESIYYNIAFSKHEATIAEVVEAAKIANAHNFIMNLDNGYETVIGERGKKLSGGERQRIAIARAILNNPSILILDEATSELDSESEALVKQALSNLMKNRTTIVIAHRLSTIQYANSILVFDNGEIKEKGTYTELLKYGKIFKKLHNSQYNYNTSQIY